MVVEESLDSFEPAKGREYRAEDRVALNRRTAEAMMHGTILPAFDGPGRAAPP
jgi:hypothetical protein